MYVDKVVDADDEIRREHIGRANYAVDLMLSVLSDDLDHPELWAMIPELVEGNPFQVAVLQDRMEREYAAAQKVRLQLILGITGTALGAGAAMMESLAPLGADFSQSPQVQGALFHIAGLLDPENPKYQLAGKICTTPFEQIDVLETSSHLCCASWLSTSAGNLSAEANWQDVWNSDAAQAIRASIYDGSYRFCNKGSCPKIQANALIAAEALAAESPVWRARLQAGEARVEDGPEVVNLAYDRTCNLACPSCRKDRFAADEGMRSRFDRMQEEKILPMLKNAKIVFVTGSGDPFASKNFRQLMHRLTPEEYPHLRFQIMTNGMLFNRRQWEQFPALHRRVKILKISTDAATGPTHELLRLGARWPVMLENMAFAGELTSAGEVDHFEIVFTVQQENYREMGDAVDLARQVGATGIYFARITNWGTFTPEEYRRKAVFVPTHPEYDAFVEHMQDPRLRDPIVLLGDLQDFAGAREEGRRVFVR